MLGIGGLALATIVVRAHHRDTRSVPEAIRYAALVVVIGSIKLRNTATGEAGLLLAIGSPIMVTFFIVAAVVGCSGPDTSNAGGSDLSDDLGATVYANSCASCHGPDLEGTDQGPSQLSIVYEPNHHSDESYRSAIRNGVQQHHWSFGDMPPVEGLTDAEVEAVISFVRSEQQRRGFQR